MPASSVLRILAEHPVKRVAFTVEDVPGPGAGAEGVRFMEVRGVAEQVRLDGPAPDAGLSSWVIRVHPHRLVSYNVAGPGSHTADLGDDAVGGDAQRPSLALTGAVADRAHEAIGLQVAELQAGLGDGDADTYDRHFASDVMWGSPYDATVDGYDTLHAIHRRMHAAGDHARSRYEIVRVLTLTPDVTVAQVRRAALDDRSEPIPSHEGEPRFSEMALYVLVRRCRTWWLAAGQNTVINIDRGAVAR